MPTSVTFPKASLEKTSGEISNWNVSAGDKVSIGDILFEVEDDKATVEVDSPADGYIGQLFETGEEIDVGGVVATIYETREDMETEASAPAAAAPVADLQEAAAPVAKAAENAPQPAPSGKIKSTPLARRIARDNGLSLTGLAGTGPNGRVQKRDVLAALAAPVAAPLTASSPTTTPTMAPDAARLNAVWYQKGTGEPVAFLHGFGADVAIWGGLLSGARYDFPAIALDLPCHGASDGETPADLDAIAARVEATLLAEGVREVTLAAHSFGGAVAARLASRGVLRIRALCLFAPAGLSPEINHAFVAAMLRSQSREALRPWLEQLVVDPSLITEAFLERSMAGRATAEKMAALQSFAQTFLPDGTQRFNVTRDLAGYLGPLRVIYGRQDRILPASAAQNLPGNAALHLWDNCGHMPHFEHRRDALRILEEVRRSA
ncbi:acetoin dehydrogenase dihydrolipoyllysine-residue acetyltransferase subunit [Pacificoceanicola onchidii]|uniref:acetoin dehydrogenase dihydrolipoyllysine-residue acetyltransferase subunit n=1 Tax=Pacificoceanicola onchidii TaxID=2562685 RepID=UPI0010A5EEEA|nr:acetoin dehydrogenase dihydrolipoyllysine-residue acetyltransferase subunit [Pacificoceanicola onchidii]